MTLSLTETLTERDTNIKHNKNLQNSQTSNNNIKEPSEVLLISSQCRKSDNFSNAYLYTFINCVTSIRLLNVIYIKYAKKLEEFKQYV